MFPSAGNLIFGICGLIGGFFVMTRAYYINHQIYFLSYPERKWGPGMGTITYRIIGLSLMIFSMFVLTGWVDLFGPAQDASTQQVPTSTLPQANNSPIQIAP